MIPAVPSRQRGARFLIFLTIILLLAAAIPAFTPTAGAREELRSAREGDPGDGTLSPSADATELSAVAPDAAVTDTPPRIFYLLPDLWLMPLSTTPTGAQAATAIRLYRAYGGPIPAPVLTPAWMRGWHDAR